MFSTLFTSKRKPNSVKSSNLNNYKTSHNLLDVLLAELDINFTNRILANDEEKSTDGFKDTHDLNMIEQNQLAYSKLMAKKLQKTKFGKKKGKSIFLHS